MNNIISKMVEAAVRFKSKVQCTRLLCEAYTAYASDNLARLNRLASCLNIEVEAGQSTGNCTAVFEAIIDKTAKQLYFKRLNGLALVIPKEENLPPLEVIQILKPGVATKFKNGQCWTLMPVCVGGIEGQAHYGK